MSDANVSLDATSEKRIEEIRQATHDHWARFGDRWGSWRLSRG